MMIAVCERCETAYIPPAFLLSVYQTKEIRCGACFGGHMKLKEHTKEEEENERNQT